MGFNCHLKKNNMAICFQVRCGTEIYYWNHSELSKVRNVKLRKLLIGHHKQILRSPIDSLVQGHKNPKVTPSLRDLEVILAQGPKDATVVRILRSPLRIPFLQGS
ncbi:hypothetical protein OTU49_006973 [Cherax quadricarinatus]|uniref:Uncharacterized protein n=1 Tax=Cherax quadricarinatus TaxID=27406 RepID=A0AAW0WJ56_CHEQU